jgi:hypothetical protein
MEKVKTLAKLVVTAILIYFIFSKVDFSTIIKILAGIRPWLILFLLAIYLLMIVLSCLKWQLFLKARSINISVSNLVPYYLIGYFFNNLLPSSVGGDLFRSYFLGKDIDSHTKSFSSVFLERITGLVALLFVAIISLILNVKLISKTPILFSIIIMSLILLSVVLFFSFEKIKNILFSLIIRFEFFAPFRDKLDKFYDSIHFFRNQWKVLAYSMLYSFAFHIMAIVNTLVCCWAIRVYPGVLDVAVTVPVIMLVSTLPISINAIGLWEGAFAYFFFLIGIPPAEAISVALILRAKSIFSSSIGGVFFALRGKRALKKSFIIRQTE